MQIRRGSLGHVVTTARIAILLAHDPKHVIQRHLAGRLDLRALFGRHLVRCALLASAATLAWFRSTGHLLFFASFAERTYAFPQG